MSAGALVLQNLGSLEWNARLYGSMSKAAEIFGIIKDRGQALRVAYSLWRLNSMMSDMLDDVYGIMEGRVKPKPAEKSPTADEIDDAERNVRRLAYLIRAMYDDANRKRMANNSVLGGPLSRMRLLADELLDLADWIDDVEHTDEVNAVFARSRSEAGRGEVFDLSQI